MSDKELAAKIARIARLTKDYKLTPEEVQKIFASPKDN
jgi:hypothetical protein